MLTQCVSAKKDREKKVYAKVTRRYGTNSTGPAVEKVKKKRCYYATRLQYRRCIIARNLDLA